MSEPIPSEINALPTDWVPNETPSKVIDKIKNRKKELHDYRLSQLKDDIARVKLNIDEKLMLESNKLKTRILTTKKRIEETIEKRVYDFTKCTPLLPDNVVVYRKLQEYITINCKDMKCLISLNNETLKAIETERQESLITVLRKARFDLENIGYLTSIEMNSYFEEEVFRLNQISLSNYYTYSELRAQLLNMVFCSETTWYRRVKDLNLAFENPRLLETKQSEYEIVDLPQVQQFTEDISKKIYTLLAKVQGALITLRDVLQLIEAGGGDKGQRLNVTLVGVPKRTYLEIYTEVYASLFEEMAYEVVTSYTEQMIEKWKEAVGVMEEAMEIYQKGVEQGTHVWDKHFERRLDAMDLFVLDLSHNIGKTEDSENASLIDLYKVIDETRMSPDEETLKTNMGECKKLIDAIKKTFEKNYENQIKYFDTYDQVMADESELLYLEMCYFVKCLPDDHDVNPTIFRGRRSRIKMIIPEDKSRLMKEFDADILAMHNWVYGVHQSLKTRMESYRNNTTNFAKNWIDSSTALLYQTFLIKIRLIEDSYQRIFHHVYRVRLAELMSHKERLDKHILAVNKELAVMCPSLQINNEEEESKDNIYTFYINVFNDQANKFMTSLKTCKTSQAVAGIMQQLASHKKTCIEMMDKIKAEVDERNAKRFDELLCLNLAYAQHVRFFGELGDYHVEELTEMKKAFATINKDLVKGRASLVRDSEAIYNKALKDVNEIEVDLVEITTTSNKKLDFKEFIKGHLTNLRVLLKEETSSLVDDSGTLSSYLSRLEKLAGENTGNIDYLDDFADNCAFMQGLFTDLYERLMQIEPFELEAHFFTPLSKMNTVKSAITGDPTTDIIVKHIQLDLGLDFGANEEESEEVKTADVGEELFRVLFPEVPAGDDYMARIIGILIESLQVLQKRAQEHFEDLHTTAYAKQLKSFMIDHLATHLYYQLQCDEILLELTINYILDMDEQLSFITNYYKLSMRAFVNDKIEELTAKCAYYKAKVRHERERVGNEYEDIIKQLKPLHGHPRNKDLLERLAEQMSTLEDKAIDEQAVMDQVYEEYQVQVEENCATFQAHFEKMEARLKECVENFAEVCMKDEHIFDQLKRKLTYFEKIMLCNANIVDGSALSIDVEIADKINSKLKQLKKGLRISSNDFATKLRNKYDHTSIVKKKYSSNRYPELASKTSSDCFEIMEYFERDQQACLQEIQDSKDILKTCEQWTNVWKTNIDTINALYEVKHVPPPIEPEPEKPKKEKKTKKNR